MINRDEIQAGFIAHDILANTKTDAQKSILNKWDTYLLAHIWASQI
jgi:hypothetical protein